MIGKSSAFICLIALMCLFGLVGCKVEEKAVFVTQKCYDLVCNLENYVVSSDTTNLFQKAQSLKIPLNSIANALDFIIPFIGQLDIVKSIENVSGEIRYVVGQVNILNQENIEKWKENVISKIYDVKSVLYRTGKYVGMNLECTIVKGEISLDDLLVNSGELNNTIK